MRCPFTLAPLNYRKAVSCSLPTRLYIHGCRSGVTLKSVRLRNPSPEPIRCRRGPPARDYGFPSLPSAHATPLTEDAETLPTRDAKRRIHAIVALRLLEVIRDQDVPPELLEDEDPSVTMPRRFGLSDVVERQIRTYREDLRRHVRLTDAEVRDLFRLVIRRPDAEEIFYKLGRMLAGTEPPGRWRGVVPKPLAYAFARSRARRKLKSLFGRRIGGFGRGSFSIEGRSLFFIEADPGGDACFFLSGFCQAVLEQATSRKSEMVHTLCQSRGDDVCRWEGSVEEALVPVPADAPPEAEVP